MISNIPTIGARFEIDKMNSDDYSGACWKVFWRAVSPKKLPGALLWEGDTRESCNGQENVFCIAVQCTNADIVKWVRSALLASAEFKGVCGDPMFVDDTLCTSEPLPAAGKVDSEGNLTGDTWNSKPALLTVSKERQS